MMADGKTHIPRQHKRVSYVNEVEVVDLGTFRCSDLSLGGMYLETVQSFPVGDVVTVRFKLRHTDEHAIRITARVLYIHEGVGVGLAFVDLNPHDREKIEKFIDQTAQGE
jgi:c-di-GMP-binding flagellar brake protein YcgR